jgi:2-aminoadipate transaminase
MYESLQRYLPDAKARKPQGGYFLWLRLPEHIDVDELDKIGVRMGVKILSGKYAFAKESPPSNFTRLAYSYENPKQIEEGIRRLALAYQEMK